MRCAFLRRSALSKLEVTDAGAPIEAGRGLVVLVRVIERAVVHRIDCEITVIAPAIGSSALAARAIEKMLLPRQGIQWIRRQSSGVTNLWAYGTAGCAKAERNVALIIRGDTAHPAPGCIRLIGALLENRPGPRLCASQFEPANSGYGIRAHGIIVQHRLVAVGKATISVTEHQPVRDSVEPGAGSRLRYAVATCWTKRSK